MKVHVTLGGTLSTRPGRAHPPGTCRTDTDTGDIKLLNSAEPAGKSATCCHFSLVGWNGMEQVVCGLTLYVGLQ